MTNKPYPYAEVMNIVDTCHNYSIGQFTKQIREHIGYHTSSMKFSTIPFTNTPVEKVLIDDINIHGTIVGLTSMSLTAFMLTKDANIVFARIREWAERLGDAYTTETVQLLISQVKGEDEASVISATYLAYYEAHIYKTRLLEDGNIVLPGASACKALLLIAKKAAITLAKDTNVAYRPILEGGYSHAVNRGGPDFMSDNAVYALRFRSGQPTSNDHLYLIISYLIAKRSDAYKDKPVHYIRVVNPIEGVTFSVDMRKVDPELLRVMRDCVYGPEFSDPSFIKLDRKQQQRLILAMVRLLESRIQGPMELVKEVDLLFPVSPDDKSNIRLFREPVVRHFTSKWLDIKIETNQRKGILLLNQLFYHLDHKDAPMNIPVTLTDDTVTDILNKTLAY